MYKLVEAHHNAISVCQASVADRKPCGHDRLPLDGSGGGPPYLTILSQVKNVCPLQTSLLNAREIKQRQKEQDKRRLLRVLSHAIFLVAALAAWLLSRPEWL